MATSNEVLLEVKNLQKHFQLGKGKNKKVLKAVDDVSFHICKGEVFGLVGESGCGKTTTGRTINRLYNPTGGEILLKNEHIDGKMTKELRSKITNNIQMIFQDPISSLNPRMTVQEIIGEGLLINKICDSKEEMIERVYDILQVIGLSKEHASRYPHEFSGGQSQRIGVARAIITNPEIIIADEPISALDVSIQAQVLNLLNDLKKSRNLTILFIAHDLAVVKYFTNRIGVMYFGKIVEMGESKEIYNNPVHPYTMALLSAVPIPNPISTGKQRRLIYNPDEYGYENDPPEMIDIGKGHLVYANEKILREYRKRNGGK